MADKTYWVRLDVVMVVRAKSPAKAGQRGMEIATRQGMFVYEVGEAVNADEMSPLRARPEELTVTE